MTIQVKAIEQYFSVVLFLILCKVVLAFESVDEILKCDHSIKAIGQYFPPMVLFIIILYKVVLTLHKCGNSNESYRAELSCGAVIMF